MSDETEYKAALQVWDKYQLTDSAGEPIDGVVVLLRQASEGLAAAWMGIFEQQAATPDLIAIARDAATMAHDACTLAYLERHRPPSPGIVERGEQPNSYVRHDRSAD